jgi:hypothetical protein
MQLTEEQAVEAAMLESQLSVLQAMILISLAAGTYYKTDMGATIADLMRDPDTEEAELISLDLVEHNLKLLALTPKGKRVAAWFVQVLREVIGTKRTAGLPMPISLCAGTISTPRPPNRKRKRRSALAR